MHSFKRTSYLQASCCRCFWNRRLCHHAEQAKRCCILRVCTRRLRLLCSWRRGMCSCLRGLLSDPRALWPFDWLSRRCLGALEGVRWPHDGGYVWEGRQQEIGLVSIVAVQELPTLWSWHIRYRRPLWPVWQLWSCRHRPGRQTLTLCR